ncbi:hypothetical protein AXF42_Ash013002 [Apostasia shenzhenica]|uniref:Transcription repressor n=1 Tax=Apostasia shenzhenica TaxID=1088818 RepID=A0A2I0ARV3_9ASPA|nr:hypothetical protein AXF42_Ash013002 [Apostasia shenzhenica]
MIGCFPRRRSHSSSDPPPFTGSTATVFADVGDGVGAGLETLDHPAADLKNFNSIYDVPCSDSETPIFSAAFSGEDCDNEGSSAGNLISTAMASSRLFSPSPGRSNSIIESAAISVGPGCAAVAVPTYSADPYRDFLQSMEEMAAALGIGGGGDLRDMAALRQLLLCYLAINSEHVHKYIVSSFADLLLALAVAGDEREVG